jgi:hypothetical protein
MKKTRISLIILIGLILVFFSIGLFLNISDYIPNIFNNTESNLILTHNLGGISVTDYLSIGSSNDINNNNAFLSGLNNNNNNNEPLFGNEFVLEDDVVIDLSTNLMWQDGSSNMTKVWNEAVNYCNDLSWAGYDDWRLPSYLELNTIMNFTQSWNDWPVVFNNTEPATCWKASISQIFDTEYIFNVYLMEIEGEYEYFNYVIDPIGLRVMCVRDYE